MTQRGRIPSLSELLAPSVYTEGGKIRRFASSERYLAALKAEGMRLPERKPLPPPSAVDASGYSPAVQLFYVKMAARDGDWRGLRGTKPTPKMQDLFVTARAKYLVWKRRRDEEEAREAELPKTWLEIEPGLFVFAHDEARARALIQNIAPIASMWHRREIQYPEIDTSRTCPEHGCRDCALCAHARARAEKQEQER